jgi:hypothetical protein
VDAPGEEATNAREASGKAPKESLPARMEGLDLIPVESVLKRRKNGQLNEPTVSVKRTKSGSSSKRIAASDDEETQSFGEDGAGRPLCTA